MFKKLFAVITALSILGALFVCPVYSAEDDQNYATDCIELMSSLDMDIHIESTEIITRGEFLYLLMQCIGYSPITVTELPFADVTPDAFYASAVKYALDSKIISASDAFNPASPIKLAEACKMTVSALGLDYYAVQKGGWPTGYIVAAGNHDITLGVGSNDVLSRDEALTVLWNFLHTNVLEPDGIVVDGENTIKYVKGDSVLGYYHDVYTAEGIITANKYTGLYEADGKCEDDEVEINDKTYKCDAGLSDMIGKNVVAYAVVSGDSAKVIYAYEKDNSTASFRAEDIGEISGKSLRYYEGDFEKKLSFTSSPAFIYNLCADKEYTLSDLKNAKGEIVAIDNNGDRAYDVVYVSECETFVAKDVNIYDKIITGEQNELVRMDDEDVLTHLYFNDKECAIGDIVAGALLEVYRSRNGEVVVIHAGTPNTVTGTLSGLNKEKCEIYIDDTSYEYNKYFETYYLSKLSMGKAISLILTSDNVVAAVGEVEDTVKYGYLIDSKRPSTGLDTEAQIKMLTSEGKIEIFTFADKVFVDGEIIKKGDIDVEALVFKDSDKPSDQATSEDRATNLIRYRATSEKAITMIDTKGEAGTYNPSLPEDNNLSAFEYPSNVYSTVWYISGTSMFHPHFRIPASAPVFVVATDTGLDEEKRFTVKSGSYFNQIKYAAPKNLFAFNVEETGNAGAVLLIQDSASAEIGESSPSGVVYSANPAINSEGEKGISLVVFRNKKYEKYFILDETILQKKDAAGNVTTMNIIPGDYVSFNANTENVVSAISRIYDRASDKITVNFGNHLDDNAYYFGRVYDKDSSGISIIPENITGLTSGSTDPAHRYRFSLPSSPTVFDTKTGSVFVGSSSEILTMLQAGDECGKIIIKTDDGVISDAILYK